MFMELQSVLRLEETSLEGKFVHICEEEDQIGTFLLHHFLHLGIKRQSKILLVGIENSFGHYNGVGLKFGLNFLKLKEEGVEFFDGLKVIEKAISDNGNFDVSAFTQELLAFLDKHASPNAYIIVDKISILQSFGLSTKDVVSLTKALQMRARQNNCVLITRCRGKSNLDSTEDFNLEDSGDLFSNLLSHSASLNIVVRPLSTGKSASVTGNICFLWTNKKNVNKYQFRVEEKDVRIFAKGTSNAVL